MARSWEGFSYPHPLKHYRFESQGKPMQMAYMDVAPTGQGERPHGAPAAWQNFCGATWERTIGVLNEAGYRVIAPDQVGFCSSSKPEGYQFSFAQLAHNTALLQQEGIDQVSVIGHSMGGMLAARLALSYPQLAEQLVLVNPIGLEDWQAEGVPYAPIDQLYQAELKTDFDSIKAYQQKFYYNGNWKPEYDRWVAMLAGMYAGEGKAGGLEPGADFGNGLHPAGDPRVSRISTPTLLLIGGLDHTAPGANRAPDEIAKRLGNYPELGRQAAAMIPQARLVAFRTWGIHPRSRRRKNFTVPCSKDCSVERFS